MTFEEWLHHRFPAGVDGYAHMLNIQDLNQAWNAAIESVRSKLDSLADPGGDITWYELDIVLDKLLHKDT